LPQDQIAALMGGHVEASSQTTEWKKQVEAAGVKTNELSDKDKDFIRQTALRLHEEWVKAQGGRTVDAWNIVKGIVKE
jgi:hypothetical protein